MHRQIPTTSATTTVLDPLKEGEQALIESLNRLLRHEQTRETQLDELELVQSLLQTLPLASGLFGTYQNRVRNAQRYLQAGETGAARYELQLMANSLRGWLAGQAPVEPRRRLHRPGTAR